MGRIDASNICILKHLRQPNVCNVGEAACAMFIVNLDAWFLAHDNFSRERPI